MSTEQSEYDELYAKGFNEQITDVDAVEEVAISTEEEVESEEQPEVVEVEPTEEPLDEEGEPEADTETEEDSNESEQKHSITIGGQEVSLTLEELRIFAQKGGDYTRKTQDLAKSRADIELMNDKNLSHEDLVMLADIKSGNKEALAVLANKAGIDPLDVDENSSYKPEVVEKNYALQDVVSEIRNDKDNGTIIDNWIAVLPEDVKSSFAKQPEILRGLHIDTKNGIGKEIMPDLIKEMAMNPNIDFVETYNTIGQKIVNSREAKEVKPEATRETKKKATVTKTKKTHIKDHQDVWNDDELYEKMKKQLADLR